MLSYWNLCQPCCIEDKLNMLIYFQILAIVYFILLGTHDEILTNIYIYIMMHYKLIDSIKLHLMLTMTIYLKQIKISF